MDFAPNSESPSKDQVSSATTTSQDEEFEDAVAELPVDNVFRPADTNSMWSRVNALCCFSSLRLSTKRSSAVIYTHSHKVFC